MLLRPGTKSANESFEMRWINCRKQDNVDESVSVTYRETARNEIEVARKRSQESGMQG